MIAPVLTGTLYLTNDINLLSNAMVDGRPHIIFDLDDQSDDLKKMFPDQAFKATILLPPPSAIFKQIDGCTEDFVNEYKGYLSTQDITDFISLIIISLHNGFDAFLYAPSYSEDSIWINILLEYFECVLGIHIGTSDKNPYAFNPTFHNMIIYILYMNNVISVENYLFLLPDTVFDFPQDLLTKLRHDLLPYSGIDEPFNIAFNRMRSQIHSNIMPAVTFE